MNMDIINNIRARIKEIHLRAQSCGSFGEIAFNSLANSKPIKPKSVKIPDPSAVISEKNSSLFSLENVHRNPVKAPVRKAAVNNTLTKTITLFSTFQLFNRRLKFLFNLYGRFLCHQADNDDHDCTNNKSGNDFINRVKSFYLLPHNNSQRPGQHP